MAEPLKDQFFTRESLQHLADVLEEQHPAFDRAQFLALIYVEAWAEMPLKEKMHHTTRAMGALLPQSYRDALKILFEVAPKIRGFEALCFPDFVEIYGQEDWERSLPALGYFTRFGSAEFAVRPFLEADPDRTLPYLKEWAGSPEPEVRRLASEGCRPRLPWGMALPKFKVDPTPLLPILEKLKDDEAETVRRSVANNLNDISKDHPELVLDLAERWYGKSERTDWIVRHALRGLLKAGNPRALRLFGVGSPDLVAVEVLQVKPKQLNVGDELAFQFNLKVKGAEMQLVRVDYAVYYVKARGNLSPKIFRLTEKEFAPGEYNLTKRHSFEDRSTRKHYPGEHQLAVIANGEEKARVSFYLQEV